MKGRPAPAALRRLRAGFVVLGVALLTPLGALAWSAESRIEAQRRLRRDVVAERVFDELEREITLMLDREASRPPYTLATTTDPATWAPFVVGYFVREGQVRVSADDRLTEEQRARVRWAVTEWEKKAPRPPAPAEPVAAVEAPTAAPRAPKALPPQQTTSPEILRQLNRAQEQKRRAPAPSSKTRDPFTDYQNF